MLKILESIKRYRNILTIALSLIGIGLMAYYDYCDTTCSYLKGDIFGIDLKWVGIFYVSVVIAFAVFKWVNGIKKEFGQNKKMTLEILFQEKD